jgi:cytochrome c556
MMHGNKNAIAAGLISAALSGVMGNVQAASGEEVIKARINFMQDDVEAHWKAIAAFVKGNGTLADVEKHARAIAKLAGDIPKHFPRDTGRGKYPDKLTRTLPVVWEKPEELKKATQRLVEGSERLARAASEGKKEEVLDLIGPGSYARTKIGCAECHDNFRGDRAK